MSQSQDANRPAVEPTSGRSNMPTDSSSTVTSSISTTQPDNVVAPAANAAAPPAHVHYAMNIDTSAVGDAAGNGHARAESRVSRSESRTFSPTLLRRRTTRLGTFKTVEDFQDFEARPGWHPGAEPGIDPSKPDGGHSSMTTLSAPCDITIVDYSQDDLSIQHFDNETLAPFLDLPQPKWGKCRWINVDGLSWDVISALGQHKKLHKLAIEDVMHTKSRTKAEWFSTHAFIVLTLQKLVHLSDGDDESDGENADALSWTSGRSGKSHRVVAKGLKRVFSGSRKPTGLAGLENGGAAGLDICPGDQPHELALRTLQRYHASPNDPRTKFMEKHSALARKNLAVACEQVSIFVTNDNTIISFFEFSGADIENPIIRRLQTADTILRQSCDASMVGQAIVDAIIDLAIPVSACYGDVIADLELDVLTRPTLNHTKNLYIIISEINKLLSFINPIVNLVQALRDHKTELSQDVALKELQNPLKGVIITPMTYTYLGDVLDHCLLITENMDRLKSAAEGMIDLIFNTLSAQQNESMKQLTVATIIFLPLTFITGYFGQNFEPFPDLTRPEGINFFWMVAAPTVFCTILLLLHGAIWDWLKSLFQRRYIFNLKVKNRSKKRGGSVRL